MHTQKQREAIFKELERESSLKGISIELSREAGKFTQEVEVPEEYKKHEHIFDPVESKKLPPSRPWDHAITLKPDAPDTIDCKLYPLPPKDDEAIGDIEGLMYPLLSSSLSHFRRASSSLGGNGYSLQSMVSGASDFRVIG